MKIRPVTGSTFKIGRSGGLWLKHVIPCGRDWVAEISIVDAGREETPKRARVFVTQNPGVAALMSLGHSRGELEIKSDRCPAYTT